MSADLWSVVLGDSAARLAELPSKSVRTIVTSPPYWGLRDYGVEGQIGLERTFVEHLDRLLEVFREARRVLADDGTLWLNVGDSYATTSPGNARPDHSGHKWLWSRGGQQSSKAAHVKADRQFGLPRKCLIGLGWRLCFALAEQQRWILRCDIIWRKKNPCPETVFDRPTREHEYVFLLSKRRRYHYNAAALAEATTAEARTRFRTPTAWDTGPGDHKGRHGRYRNSRLAGESSTSTNGREVDNDVRNGRSVWEIQCEQFRGGHTATFPVELARRCVVAGSDRGDLVLDPFCGAGTTGIAALQLGRRFVGVELNPKYAAIARRRLERVDGTYDEPTKSPSAKQLALFRRPEAASG